MTTPDTRLLCLDIDGTLVDGTGYLYADVGEIRRLRALGYLIGVSSARPEWAITPIAKALGGADFIVALQGAYGRIWPERCSGRGTEGVRYEIPSDVVNLVRRSLRPGKAMWTYTESCWYVNHLSDVVHREAAIVGRLPDEVGCEKIPGRVLKLILPCAGRHEIASHMALLKTLPVSSSISHGRYIEVISKNALRAKGLPWVLQQLGVPRDRSVAVGDSENDVGMLGWAGLGFTFKTAGKRVRSVSDVVIRPPDLGGLLDLVDILERGVLNV